MEPIDPGVMLQAANGFSVTDSIVEFIISALLGGLAIHVGTIILFKRGDYSKAVVTALAGALVWTVLSGVHTFGWILAPLGWIIVIKWQYKAGWLRSIGIGVAAWFIAGVGLWILGQFGIGGFEALGVPPS